MPWAPVPAPWAHQALPGAEPVWGPSGAAIETTWDPKLEGVQKDRRGSVFTHAPPRVALLLHLRLWIHTPSSA